MRPKLKYQPITPVTNTSADIPPTAIGFIVEVYHNDGYDKLGRVSYNNASRSIDFNKKKTGGSGHGYYPKYTQQIFLTKDQNGIFPTRLTAYSNGGHVSIKGWLILEKITRKPAQYLFEPTIESVLKRGNEKYFNINETFIFSCYNGFVKLPVMRLISGKNKLSIMTVDPYNYYSDPMVFYFATAKGLIVGKTISITNKEGEYLFLVCKSSVDKVFFDNDIPLTITTFYCEATTDIKITVEDTLSDVENIYKILDTDPNIDLLLDCIETRLENFNRTHMGGNDIVS